MYIHVILSQEKDEFSGVNFGKMLTQIARVTHS